MHGRIGDIVERGETRGDLIARGWTEEDAEAGIAFRVLLDRRANPDLELARADHDYESGDLSSRSYLEQIAPEELDR